MARAIAEKTCNALLLKVNQIGTVSESIEAVLMAQAAGECVCVGKIAPRKGERMREVADTLCI